MTGPPRRTPATPAGRWIAALAALVVVGGVFAVMWPQQRHNRQMQPWVAEFVESPAPDRTFLLESGSGVGEPPTGGNACAQVAWVLLKTATSPQAVQDAYEERFPSDDGDSWFQAEDAGRNFVRVYRVHWP